MRALYVVHVSHSPLFCSVLFSSSLVFSLSFCHSYLQYSMPFVIRNCIPLFFFNFPVKRVYFSNCYAFVRSMPLSWVCICLCRWMCVWICVGVVGRYMISLLRRFFFLRMRGVDGTCLHHYLLMLSVVFLCFYLQIFFLKFSRILLSKHFKMLNLVYSVGIIFFPCVFTKSVLVLFFVSLLSTLQSVLFSLHSIFPVSFSFFFAFFLFCLLSIFAFHFSLALFIQRLAYLLVPCGTIENWVLARPLFFAPHTFAHTLSDLYTWFGHTCCH